MPQPRIKVFWDLESCPPPPAYPGSPWDLLKSIRLFTSRFGIVTSIRAYWDRNKSQDSGANAGPLRSTMPSMGISLVDCSLAEEYSGDALARMLTVDVLVSAIDDSANADASGKDIIMIFSGDKTILHPISLLMFRGYTIFLVVPDDNDSILSSHATRVFSWHTNVLKPKSSSSPESAPVPVAEHSKAHAPSSGGMRPSPNLNGTKATLPMSPPQSSSSMAPSRPMSPPPSAAPFNTMSPQHPSRSIAPSQPMSPPKQPSSLASSYPMSPRMFTAATSPAATPKTKLRSITASEPAGSRAPSALSMNAEASASNFGFARNRNAHKGSTTSSDIRAQMLDQISPTPPQAKEVQDANDDWGVSPGWNDNGAWEMAGSSWLSEAEQKAAKQKPAAAPEVSKPIQPTAEGRDALPWTEPQTETPQVGDSAFEPLLQFLREARAEGKTTVLRSQVGGVLAKDKAVYKDAGVKGFGEYIALAVARDLVAVGGEGGKEWVRLRSWV